MPDRVSYLRAWKLSKVYLDAQWWDPLVSTPVKLLTDCLYLCWPSCFTVLMREGRGFLLSRNKAAVSPWMIQQLISCSLDHPVLFLTDTISPGLWEVGGGGHAFPLATYPFLTINLPV